MTTRKHSSLRRLALAYYRGHIVRERYLELRSRYLQAITEGKEPAPITSDEIAPEVFDISSSRLTSDDGKNKPLLISILAAAAVIIIIAIVAAVSSKPTASESSTDTGKADSSSMQKKITAI